MDDPKVFGEYDLVYDMENTFKEVEGERLSCWGQKGYAKPKLSDIWVPAYLVEKPIRPKQIPHSLDVVIQEPRFSVIPKKYESCVPKSVKALIREHFSQMPEESKESSTGNTSSSNNVSSESLTGNKINSLSSTSYESDENMPNSSMHNKLPVYKGTPIIYQKNKIENKLPINQKAEKNKKKFKKNKQKRQNTATDVVLVERQPYEKNAVAFECKDSRHFSLDFGNLSHITNNDGNVMHARFDYMKEHFKQNAYDKPKLDVNPFPELPKGKSFLKDELKYEEVKEAPSPSYPTDVVVNDQNGAQDMEASSIVVLTNIPVNVDPMELSSFVDSYADAAVVSTTVHGNCLSVELRMSQENAFWIADCVNGSEPFNACTEPVKCYVKE